MMICKTRTLSFRHRHFGFRITCVLILGYVSMWSFIILLWTNQSDTRQVSRDTLCQSLECRNTGQLRDVFAVGQSVMRERDMTNRTNSEVSALTKQSGDYTVNRKNKPQRKVLKRNHPKHQELKGRSRTREGKATTEAPLQGRTNIKKGANVRKISQPSPKTNGTRAGKVNKKLKNVKKDSVKAVKDDRSVSKQNHIQGKTKDREKMAAGRPSSFNHTETRNYFKLKGVGLDSLLNRHRYVFSLLPAVCSHKSGVINVIIIVHTALQHGKKRQTLRESLRAKTFEQGFGIGFVFLIGQTDNINLQKLIKREAHDHNDLVQGNFLDSYHNLTYKHIMGYHWVLKYCKDVEYVIKIDDDVIINIENVIGYITEKTVPDGYIACSAYRKSKIKKRGKWSNLRKQFPFTLYPPYCSGFAYIVPLSVVERLYNASLSVRYFWIDDVYVTGLLTLATGTELLDLSKTEAHKHLTKAPIPEEITENALFIFNDPRYIVQS